MSPTQEELEQEFERINDEELLARCASGTLTEDAQFLAVQEALRRGLTPPAPRPASSAPPPDDRYYGDFVIVVRDLNMAEADVYRMLLQSAGVPAEVGDSNFSRAYGSTYSAIVKVPEAYLEQAREIFAAFRRGDFALDDDFEADGK